MVPIHRPALAGLLLVLLAPAAQATTFLNVSAHDPGDPHGWFRVDGLEGRNPTLRLTAGEEVTLNFTNYGTMPHNIAFPKPLSVRTPVLEPGENATLTFTVPADAPARFPYWCDPHRSHQMIGTVEVEGGAAAAEAPAAGPLAAFAVLGLAAALRRR